MAFEPHTRRILTSACLLGCALLSDGCKPDAAVQQPAVVGRGTKDPQGPAQTEPQSPNADVPLRATSTTTAYTGSIGGTILFHGKPPAGTIDTSMDPACAMGGGKARLPVEQYAVTNGKLANVFLYVKSGPPEAMQAAPNTAQPVVMDQKSCQYVPHVVGVAAGGYVEFRNSDLTMHNVHSNPTDIGNETIDISEGPHGTPQSKQFRRPELMIPVRCNNHPWMNAFVNVSQTPFFAVSDVNGHFDLRGLPPGDYVIGAVHEKMGEKTMKVTVPPHGAATAEFSFAL